MAYPNTFAAQAGPIPLSQLDANFNFAVDIQSQALYAAAGGSADAITATYSPAVTALVSGLTLHLRAASANATTTPTFSPNGLTAKTIVKANNQALIAGDIAGAGQVLILQYDSTNGVWELANPATNKLYPQIYSVTASVASSALTVTLNPCALDFRATPLTSGTVNTRTVGSAISVVVPSTATLGTVSAQQSRIVVLALDNAGTIELAVVNISGGTNLDETTLISTTAIAAGSNTATVVYSTTARTSLPFRVVGYVESTQATAGTWATAPSTIQGYGGQALAAMSSLGYSQTWQNLTGSRVIATTYYNTTGKPISVSCFLNGGSAGYAFGTVNGVNIQGQQANAAGSVVLYVTFIVPPGGSYSATISTSPTSVNAWQELR